MENIGYRIIGFRKGGLGFLYIFTLFLGIGMFISGFFLFDPNKEIKDSFSTVFFCFVGGPMLTLMSVVILIQYFSTSSIAISKDGKMIKVNGKELLLSDITDVSYKKARAKNITYNFGSVIVKSKNTYYTARYIADCESVSKEITRLMYEKKNKEEQFEF